MCIIDEYKIKRFNGKIIFNVQYIKPFYLFHRQNKIYPYYYNII